MLDLIARESAADPWPAVEAIAEAAREQQGPGIVAVLFYGSVRRDQDDEGGIIDLYLLAESYAGLRGSWLRRVLNALLPPNVFYLETAFEGRQVRAKYAVITLSQFERAVGPKALLPYFWARFAQPVSLIWSRDEASQARVRAALAQAVETMVRSVWPLFEAPPRSPDFWTRAFTETYHTELRAEKKGRRAQQIYEYHGARYDRLLGAIPEARRGPSGARARRRAQITWWLRRVLGKACSVLRLMKAAFTFYNGADYLVWKINRHSGVEIELTPWQRRHPILAGWTLIWRLLLRGAVR
ncbi:MAG: hypothetical protein QNJ30_17060 [Kiloniellales bacterium]|nr:hypothetical protein [Kiloniellales bacterium]